MRPCRHWLWLLLLLPLGLGLARLRFDVDILNPLPANLSVAHGLQLYQKHFANSGELIITLQAPTAGERRPPPTPSQNCSVNKPISLPESPGSRRGWTSRPRRWN